MDCRFRLIARLGKGNNARVSQHLPQCVASLVERALGVLTTHRSHCTRQDRPLKGRRRHQPWDWFSAATCTQRVRLGAYRQPNCRAHSRRALFVAQRDRDVMNMGGAAGMTAVHTVRGCHLPAALDMATPIIWSRYHRRLPFTAGEITDIAG